MLLNIVEDSLPRLFAIFDRLKLGRVLVLKQLIDDFDMNALNALNSSNASNASNASSALDSILDEGVIETAFELKIRESNSKSKTKDGWVIKTTKQVSETVSDIVESTFGRQRQQQANDENSTWSLIDIAKQFSFTTSNDMALRFIRIGISLWRQKKDIGQIDYFDIVTSLLRKQRAALHANDVRASLLVDTVLAGYTEVLEILNEILSDKLGNKDLARNLAIIKEIHVSRLKHLYALKTFSIDELT